MFRDGHYLEVIKASDTCLATAIVTVQERTVEIKKRKVSTNKWLELEDWAALYKILKRALIRRCDRNDACSRRELEGRERRKVTRQLDVTYTFESSNNSTGTASLFTIRVNVSPAKRKTTKDKPRTQANEENIAQNFSEELYDANSTLKKANEPKESKKEIEIKEHKAKVKKFRDSKKSKDLILEEYIPDTPAKKKHCPELKYIPSKKSTLENMQVTSDEYSPIFSNNNNSMGESIRYIPNSIGKNISVSQTYEPSSITMYINPSKEYVPNSKGTKATIEEYQPDFTSKLMKFDESYVPSSMQSIDANKKEIHKRTSTGKLQRSTGDESQRKRSSINKDSKYLFS